MYGINPLREYNKFVGLYAGMSHALTNTVWKFWNDIHPRTESQYKAQMFLRGVLPWYDSWMVNRSADERNRNTRGMYNVGFSDITYPHLSGITSENTTKMLGGASWTFSKNMARLYK